jgi:D-alanyl-D-alanine carboxypeptidase/D-alanyl-D-alanine-endopeptidase (penicillin-binding protein 4)
VAGLTGTRRAAVAIDLESGEVLFQQQRYVGLEPASNEKLPVTFAALHILGGTFRITTDVLGNGDQAGTVWRGNLFLKGHGDPTLSYQDLKHLAWLVRGAGIRRVTGSIVGDESYFDSKRGVWGWKSYFYGGESPPLSALTVDRCIYQGRLAASPALAAAALFRQALKGAGVKVAGKSRVGRATEPAIPLAHVSSAPLWKILRYMDSWSDNFTAELVLKQLGAHFGHGTSPGGAAAVRKVLTDSSIPMAGVRIVDGSGLSSKDRLTVAALVGILASAWSDTSLRKPFQAVLAVAGRTGTLRNRLLGASTKGHVVAKTGTTDDASALTGYVKGRYAFAILHNGYPLASWYAKEAEDRFVQVLAAAR